jgi:8-oxo-dGTP diphosphatase
MTPTPIAIAVVEQDGHFLVGQRPPGVPLAGLWEFPGGKIEPDETPESTAVRECLEETGVEVAPLFRYPEHIETYDHGRVRLHFIACRPQSAKPAKSPREPFRWVRRTDLAGLEFPAGNAALIELLQPD